MDILTLQERSERMRRVRRRDTGPEQDIRRTATELGYRYRLQYNRLPGRPDLAFPGRKKVIWVHGCFWHRHSGCRLASTPKTNRQFWMEKFYVNQRRDRKNADMVRKLGWHVMVIWQCEIGDKDYLRSKMATFLGPPTHMGRRSPPGR